MAEQDNNLDDLLDGESPAMDASQPEQEMAPQPEPSLDAGPEPEAQQVETGEPNDVPPTSERQDDGPLVPRKALEDERRKRQENEQRVQQMEAWIAQQQQAMQPPPQAEQQPQVDSTNSGSKIQRPLLITSISRQNRPLTNGWPNKASKRNKGLSLSLNRSRACSMKTTTIQSKSSSKQ